MKGKLKAEIDNIVKSRALRLDRSECGRRIHHVAYLMGDPEGAPEVREALQKMMSAATMGEDALLDSAAKEAKEAITRLKVK
jgi:hypothetical protein